MSALLGGVTAPIWALSALAIKLHDRGPLLYRATRIGLMGTPFTIYKFRTMIVGADRIGSSSTAADDPRITRIGHWLRRFKLDELPQLLNVLSGDMSVVGPRPQVDWDVARYTDDERRLLLVKPGITDWASIRFRNEAEILEGHADVDVAYDLLIRPDKIRLGLEYVDTATFLTDLKIVLATLRAVVSKGQSPA